MEGEVMACVKVLFRYLSGGTEGNHETPVRIFVFLHKYLSMHVLRYNQHPLSLVLEFA
jgi:hypothetical protein